MSLLPLERTLGWSTERWSLDAYWPYRSQLQRFATRTTFPSEDELSELLPSYACNAAGTKLRFGPAVHKTRRRKQEGSFLRVYDGSIAERGIIPMRENNWHDFFNALAWITFPKIKLALHQRQLRVLRATVQPTATKLPGMRTREQDALAMLDEGGMLLVARDDVVLEESELQQQSFATILYGHALLEHLVLSETMVRGSPFVLSIKEPCDTLDEWLRAVDDAGAARIEDESVLREPGQRTGIPVAPWLFTNDRQWKERR